MQDADSDRLLRDLEDLGRRQPMAVVFGGLALGFAASRCIKASSQQRYATSQASPGYASSPPPAGRSLPAPDPRADGNGAAPGAYGDPVGPGIGAPFTDPVVEPERTDPLAPRPPSTYPGGGV